MISREIFAWFDSSIVKQSKLIYAIRKIFIMADLSDKHYTALSLVNTLRLSPSIRKIYFIRQIAIIVKK